MQNVLRQALQTDEENDVAVVRRLEGLGFDHEVIKVALHVAKGDEQRAMQLCLSGLAFVHSGNDSTLEDCAPPAPLKCYICAQRHLTERSLEIHLKACRRRFEVREAKRPQGLRRLLLEEDELPEGMDCLEHYYQAQAGTPASNSPNKASNLTTPFEAWFAKQEGAECSLLPCEFCKRTFSMERLEVHQKACLQRPRPDVASQTPPARRCPSTPPAAMVRAYASFCNQLERCQGCLRQFRPELLQAHQKLCCPPKQLKTRRLSAASLRSSSPGQSDISSYRAQGGMESTPAMPSRCAQSSSLAQRRSRSSTGGISFTPPSRYVPPKSQVSSAVPPASSPSLFSHSSADLLTKGLISTASEEDKASIRSRLAERLPGVEVIAVYKAVNDNHRVVYNALRSTAEAQRGGCAPEERELWHGTSWAFVPKILRQGFNRSFAGRHGTLLGSATYFSSDPAYSQKFCDKKGGGRDSTKALLLATVLVGNYCKGCSTDVEPPIKDAETGERYDSTVENEDSPSIFAIFRDFQALPLFLVELKV